MRWKRVTAKDDVLGNQDLCRLPICRSGVFLNCGQELTNRVKLLDKKWN